MLLPSEAQRGLAHMWRTAQLHPVAWTGTIAPMAVARWAVSLTLSFSLIRYQNQNHQINIETAGPQRETRYTPVTLFK